MGSISILDRNTGLPVAGGDGEPEANVPATEAAGNTVVVASGHASRLKIAVPECHVRGHRRTWLVATALAMH